MYGHRDQSHSGEKRERHPHHRGSASHSSRERSKKQHRESRKERDHGGHRGSSRRVSSGGGNAEKERGSRGVAGTSDLMAARRSSKDSTHHVRSSDNRTEDFARSSQSGRNSVSGGSSVDELVGNKGSIDNLPMDVSSESSRKSDETSVASKGFGGFILHEAISPPSEDFESGSIKAGGFEICMPVIRSNSNESLTNTSGTTRRPEDLWGAVVELRTTPLEPQQVKTPLYERDWKPGPLICSVPKTTDVSITSQPSEETDNTRILSVLDHPRDRHGRNLILHSIDMQQYLHETHDFLSAMADDRDRELSPSDMVPDKPQRFYAPTSSGSKILSSDQTLKLPSVNLSQQGLNQLLKKSTASICSFSGYEWATSESLNVLSDVLGKYLANFSKLLRTNTDHCSMSNGCRGFQDALERSLHQTGLDGKEDLCRYWKEEVQGQAQLLDMEADEVRSTCLRMTLTEDLHRSSKPPALTSPFSRSRIFALDDQQTSEIPEAISLETAMKEGRAQPQVTDPSTAPPASYSALNSPDLGPLDYLESFDPLEIDRPPRKRLRTSPLGQDCNKT